MKDNSIEAQELDKEIKDLERPLMDLIKLHDSERYQLISQALRWSTLQHHFYLQNLSLFEKQRINGFVSMNLMEISANYLKYNHVEALFVLAAKLIHSKSSEEELVSILSTLGDIPASSLSSYLYLTALFKQGIALDDKLKYLNLIKQISEDELQNVKFYAEKFHSPLMDISDQVTVLTKINAYSKECRNFLFNELATTLNVFSMKPKERLKAFLSLCKISVDVNQKENFYKCLKGLKVDLEIGKRLALLNILVNASVEKQELLLLVVNDFFSAKDYILNNLRLSEAHFEKILEFLANPSINQLKVYLKNSSFKRDLELGDCIKSLMMRESFFNLQYFSS